MLQEINLATSNSDKCEVTVSDDTVWANIDNQYGYVINDSWYQPNNIQISTGNGTISLTDEINRLIKENEDLKYVLNRLGDILKDHNINFDAEQEIKNRDILNNI